MKKTIALLLALVMLALPLAGCSSSDTKETKETTAAPAPTLDTGYQGAIGGNEGYTFPTLEWEDNTDPTEEEELPPVELAKLGEVSVTDKIQHDDMKYVMVYNPAIYDECLEENIALSTGKIEDQIIVDMDRADGLTEDPIYTPMSQAELTLLTPNGKMEDNRADLMGRIFLEGDVEAFYTYDASMEDPRILREFTCIYAGEYCNIWSYNGSISKQEAAQCGEAFDTDIAIQMTEKFGDPRFDSQVNFLYYPMQDGLLGCFSGMDLLAEPELPYFNLENSGANTSVNLLHMNSLYEPTGVDSISTLAHEFQHLICFTNALANENLFACRTWMDEAMSGYVEEMIYPGIQYHAGRMDSYMGSDLIRYGQSLYNFTTNTESREEWDIGVYGSVYLFASYLERLGGEDVFANFHNYWRNSYSETLCEAEALVNAVPGEVLEAVSESVIYPTEFSYETFYSAEEEWMSKLTLQFYLDLLDMDESDPADFHNVETEALLYDQLDPAMIEGGGRVLLQTKGDTYEVPTQSGTGLIYVALDADFNVLSISIH